MDPTALADALRIQIEEGMFPPGTVLKQEKLATAFGVSRQPVRQALDRMLTEGLVVRRSDRSLAVYELTPKESRELIEIRVLLESYALRQSVHQLTPADLRKISRLA